MADSEFTQIVNKLLKQSNECHVLSCFTISVPQDRCVI